MLDQRQPRVPSVMFCSRRKGRSLLSPAVNFPSPRSRREPADIGILWQCPTADSIQVSGAGRANERRFPPTIDRFSCTLNRWAVHWEQNSPSPGWKQESGQWKEEKITRFSSAMTSGWSLFRSLGELRTKSPTSWKPNTDSPLSDMLLCPSCPLVASWLRVLRKWSTIT